MAKLFAQFILFLLFSLIPRPDSHAVEARLLLKKPYELRRLSSQEVEVIEPAKSGPSPGAGHEFGKKEDSKKSVVVDGYSVPSPGAGHAFGHKEDSKRTTVFVNGHSVPSSGAGHVFGRKEYSKRSVVVNANSGPSPGDGHKHDPVGSIDENKS